MRQSRFRRLCLNLRFHRKCVGCYDAAFPWLVFVRLVGFIRITCFALLATLIFCLLIVAAASHCHTSSSTVGCFSLFDCLHHYHHDHHQSTSSDLEIPLPAPTRGTPHLCDGSSPCLKLERLTVMWLHRERTLRHTLNVA